MGGLLEKEKEGAEKQAEGRAETWGKSGTKETGDGQGPPFIRECAQGVLLVTTAEDVFC